MAQAKKFVSFSTIFQLLPYIADLKVRLIFSLGVTFFTIFLNLSIPVILKNIINYMSSDQHVWPTFMALLLITYGVSYTLSQLLAHVRALLINRILERGMRLLSLKVLDHLLNLSLRFHFDRSTGAITNYIDRAQYGLESIFWGLSSFLIPTFFQLMFVTIFISYLFGIMYGIILIAIMVAYIYFSFTAMSKAIQAQEIHNKLRAQASARMVDSLLNFETVKYFNNEKYEREHAANLLYQQEEAGIERFAQYTQVQMNQVLIIGIGFTFLTWLSGTSVYAGTMSVGDFVLINGYILGFIGPLHHFSYIMQIVRKGIEDMESIIKILHLEPEIEDMPQAHNIHISKAQITFEHIFFGYAPDRIILKNISFDVPAGKTIALVGPSGAGKSTIARLLFRFYDINAGNIKINGIDIRAISQQSLRKAIGIVPQDTVLFNDTIYYNIAYGNPHASQEEVKKAAELAHLGNFIQSLPQGYKTIVGERGLKLSGGEKQRVAIARVLLKKPSIYIFDEATSSLDSNTEKEIQKNLQEISVGTTTIIIAHRLSTIIYADEIYVLDCGQIIEHETHMQLLKEQGLYANLWQKQQHEYNAPN